jgi:large subunit ribosomal protein L7Ae
MSASKGKKVAAPPLAAKKVQKVKKVKSALIAKKPRNFAIGNDIQPVRDLTRYVRWPKYVTLQRKKRVLVQRLKVSERSVPLTRRRHCGQPGRKPWQTDSAHGGSDDKGRRPFFDVVHFRCLP